jgi:hypothetical protein
VRTRRAGAPSIVAAGLAVVGPGDGLSPHEIQALALDFEIGFHTRRHDLLTTLRNGLLRTATNRCFWGGSTQRA